MIPNPIERSDAGKSMCGNAFVLAQHWGDAERGERSESLKLRAYQFESDPDG
jgi:hypothetical protein